MGHLPRNISTMCSIFIRHGGIIYYTVLGRWQYSRYLPQGGMEIPCILHFVGIERELKKVKQFFSSIPSILATTQPQSSVRGTQPAVRGTQPAVRGTQPAVRGTQPAVRGTQPAVSGTQSAVSGIQPAVNDTQPGVSGSQPAVSDTQPAVSSTQLAVNITQPSVNIIQPAVSNTQLQMKNVEDSPIESEVPVGGSTQPIMSIHPETVTDNNVIVLAN